jgi:putative Mg2+ transporter-C (MgtC) family protein
MDSETQILLRLAVAALLGAVIGIERERKHKPIGLRTNMLIAIVGALIMVLSMELTRGTSVDPPSRIAAALIQGLGFLGAGAILHGRGPVTGLTTAAVLLAVASIGLAAGAGAWLLAVTGTLLTLLVLAGFGHFEEWIHKKCKTVTYSFEAGDPIQLIVEINRVLGEQNIRLHGIQTQKEGTNERVAFEVCQSRDLENTVLARLLQKGVTLPQKSADSE